MCRVPGEVIVDILAFLDRRALETRIAATCRDLRQKVCRFFRVTPYLLLNANFRMYNELRFYHRFDCYEEMSFNEFHENYLPSLPDYLRTRYLRIYNHFHKEGDAYVECKVGCKLCAAENATKNQAALPLNASDIEAMLRAMQKMWRDYECAELEIYFQDDEDPLLEIMQTNIFNVSSVKIDMQDRAALLSGRFMRLPAVRYCALLNIQFVDSVRVSEEIVAWLHRPANDSVVHVSEHGEKISRRLMIYIWHSCITTVNEMVAELREATTKAFWEDTIKRTYEMSLVYINGNLPGEVTEKIIEKVETEECLWSELDCYGLSVERGKIGHRRFVR